MAWGLYGIEAWWVRWGMLGSREGEGEGDMVVGRVVLCRFTLGFV